MSRFSDIPEKSSNAFGVAGTNNFASTAPVVPMPGTTVPEGYAKIGSHPFNVLDPGFNARGHAMAILNKNSA